MPRSCWDKPWWSPASTTARTLLFCVKNVCCYVWWSRFRWSRFPLVFNQTKQACTTPVLITLHLLPVAACVNFKSLVLTSRGLAGTAPSYLNNCVPAHLPLVHSVPHVKVIWQSCLCRHGNPDNFFILFPNGGTTSRASSKQGQPSLPLKSSSEIQLFRVHLLSEQHLSFCSNLVSPPLSFFPVYIPLHSLSITLHFWLVVTLGPGSLGP